MVQRKMTRSARMRSSGASKREDAFVTRPSQRTRFILLLALAYLSLGVAWVFSNPVGAAPDEPDHYVRALAVGRGQFFGEPMSEHDELWADRAGTVDYSKEQEEAYRAVTRMVQVPARLAPPDDLACFAFDPTRSAACMGVGRAGSSGRDVRIATSVATYPPLLYVLPGVASVAARNSTDAILLGRMVMMLLATALIVLAAWLLWPLAPHGTAVLGLIMATTPMVVFVSATLSASGLEIGAGTCVSAGLVHLSCEGPDRRAAWAGVGGGLLILAIARPAAVVLVGGALVLTLVHVGWDGVRAFGRDHRTAVVGWGLAIATGLLLTIAWGLAVVPKVLLPFPELLQAVASTFGWLFGFFSQGVGVFGWLDTAQPWVLYRLYIFAFFVLTVCGFVLGGRRERVQLLCAIGVCGAVIAAQTAAVAYTGFGFQMRWALPLLVYVPIHAGVVVMRRLAATSSAGVRRLVALAVGLVGVAQFVGLLSNARRYATGIDGPVWFLDAAEWSPPAGWVTWLVLGAMGSLGLASWGLLAQRRTGIRRSLHAPSG